MTTPVTGFNAKTELLNQLFLVAAANNVLNTLKSQQNEVWYYRFDWDEEPAPFNDIYGAAHAFDLPFIFGNFGPSLFSNIANSTANQPGRLALSEAMMRSLGAFARSGDPNARGARGHVADVALQADLRRHANSQGHLGAVADGAGPGPVETGPRMESWWCRREESNSRPSHYECASNSVSPYRLR